MPELSHFYKNQTIFLTGVTGFLGKIILEKILFSCPDVRRVYVLVRAKKNHHVQEERLKALLEEKCFDRLRLEQPNFHEKIYVINGDCSAPALRLTSQDRETLTNEVTCIIHSAANVNFLTNLQAAMLTNVRSTRDLLEIASKCKNLTSFVYVSTAFSHCYRTEIDETFYDVPCDPENLIKLVEDLDDDTLVQITPQILGKWPNTYVFTKAMAEQLVRNWGTKLPCAIVRPGIVLSCAEEPLPGWVDNFNGMTGLVVGVSLGVLRSIHADPKARASVIPADYAVNCILTSASCIRAGEVKIYNVVNNMDNDITWGDTVDALMGVAFKYPLSKVMWYYYFSLTKYTSVHKVRVFFLHILFAYLVDMIRNLCGKKPMAVRKYRHINQMIDSVSFFSVRSWKFNSDNFQTLCKDLCESDRKKFTMDMKHFDWNRFFVNAALGGRIYLMKDPLDTLPGAKRKILLLACVHYTLIAILCLGLLKTIFWMLM